MKNEMLKNLVVNFYDKKRICHTRKKFKANIKLWVSIKKVHRVESLNSMKKLC